MALSPTTPRIPALKHGVLEEVRASAFLPEADLENVLLDGGDLGGADLGLLTLSASRLHGVSAHQSDWEGAAVIDSRIERMDAPVLTAARSRWRGVRFEGSRLGSAAFVEANWQSVHLVGCKLGYLGLRGATVRDVLLTDCTIDELDLSGASVTRLAFEGTQSRALDLTGARLEKVDLRGLEFRSLRGLEGLRGAVVTPYQAGELAAIVAERFGYEIRD